MRRSVSSVACSYFLPLRAQAVKPPEQGDLPGMDRLVARAPEEGFPTGSQKSVGLNHWPGEVGVGQRRDLGHHVAIDGFEVG